MLPTHAAANPIPRPISVALTTLLAFLATACAPESVRRDTAIDNATAQASHGVLAQPEPPPPDIALAAEAIILERLRMRAETHRARSAARLRLDARAPGYTDVWARMRAGFRLAPVERHRFEAELAWYRARPAYLQRVTNRARPYLAYIVHEAARRGLPTELALLPVVESAFQPYARSPAGAMGIWQFIRSTGLHYGLRQTAWYDGRRDIVESTRAAFDYLQTLHAEMEGDWLLAIAAYNAGEGYIRRAVADNLKRGAPRDFWSLSLPAETRAYVPRLLAIASLVARPEQHGITLDPVDDEPYFTTVATRGQIELARAAEMAGIELNELMLLNPGYMRHATDPNGPHQLALPSEAVASFQSALAALPDDQRFAWSTHRVSDGDTLSAIARRYGVTIQSLREANHVADGFIRVGQEIRVPRGPDPQAYDGLSKDVREGMIRARLGAHRRSFYSVRKGDSLWSISHRHGVRVTQLMDWNALGKRSVLRPGQRLVIRHPPKRTVTGETVPRLHRVTRGDTLWDIARRYRVTTDQLIRWNKLKRNAVLHPGQQLRIGPTTSSNSA